MLIGRKSLVEVQLFTTLLGFSRLTWRLKVKVVGVIPHRSHCAVIEWKRMLTDSGIIAISSVVHPSGPAAPWSRFLAATNYSAEGLPFRASCLSRWANTVCVATSLSKLLLKVDQTWVQCWWMPSRTCWSVHRSSPLWEMVGLQCCFALRIHRYLAVRLRFISCFHLLMASFFCFCSCEDWNCCLSWIWSLIHSGLWSWEIVAGTWSLSSKAFCSVTCANEGFGMSCNLRNLSARPSQLQSFRTDILLCSLFNRALTRVVAGFSSFGPAAIACFFQSWKAWWSTGAGSGTVEAAVRKSSWRLRLNCRQVVSTSSCESTLSLIC